jgi:hypothetical protein
VKTEISCCSACCVRSRPITVPTCTCGGNVASTLGVPHGVGCDGSLGVHVPAAKPGPTSPGSSSAAWAWSSTVASSLVGAPPAAVVAELVAVGRLVVLAPAAVVTGAAVAAAVVVTEWSGPPRRRSWPSWWRWGGWSCWRPPPS